MNELKPLNDKLFYAIKTRKDKHKNHITTTITIASSYSFTGFIIIKINRQLQFAKTIKHSNISPLYKDAHFLKIIENIKEIKEIEELVLYLTTIGFYDILKRIEFLTEMVSKYKLLKE